MFPLLVQIFLVRPCYAPFLSLIFVTKKWSNTAPPFIHVKISFIRLAGFRLMPTALLLLGK